MNDLLGYDKVKITIDRIREFEPEEGYFFSNSGGKDSGVVYYLLCMANAKFDSHFNITTVDPPELLKFIKNYFPETICHRPKKTMW
jgi:phosphoadenosine phosphosulfate reductase